ncbi:hypothetical protein Ancab_032102 [Ancistrocladus abbreviatus]
MSTLLQSLFLYALFIFLSSVSYAQKDEFVYDGFSKVGSNITFHDSAKLISKNQILQLTNATTRLMGHAFYASPIKFKNSANGSAFSFSTAFTFATVPEFQTLGGHGFAFTVSPPTNNLSTALPSQYLGLFNSANVGNFSNHIFAVEFDTVQDFEFADIDDNHIGIDLNNLVSNYSATAAYFMENSTKVNVTMKSGSTIQAWIDYDSVNGVVNVTISPFESKPKRPLISYKVDLSPILHEYMQVGFSCSTGLLASSHYILGWSYNMTGPAQSLRISALPPSSSSSHKHRALAIALSVSFFVLFILIILAGVYTVRRIKNRDVIEEWELQVGPHRYLYKELKEATKGFRDTELLGRGGFGRVYKGMLRTAKAPIAVKRISHESRQGLREFVAEIASIGRLRHRNLVQLLGWCRRSGDLLLVYDYMPNGSLDKYLFDDPKLLLNWDQRFKIVKGVASGLCYLHEGWEQVVIHRDIKASNVLLDGDLNGRVGDFGLARLHDHGSNLSTTRVVGTLGYLAPELSRTGKATTCTDVFAFGTLLLEVVCGRRPIDVEATGDEVVLMDWVWAKWREGKVLDIVDPKLKGDYDENEVVMVLKLGLMCSCDAPTARPTMRQVVRSLDGEVPLPNVLRPPYREDDVGSEDFVHGLALSSYDLLSLNSSSVGEGISDSGHAGVPSSPRPLLSDRVMTA